MGARRHGISIIRKYSDKRPWICRSFINLTEWRERRVTCQQQIGNIKHVKKYRIVTAFLRVGNPCIAS